MSINVQSLRPSNLYRNITVGWFLGASAAYCVGLYNATLLLSEKGLYLMLLVMSVFTVISVQKNIRDRFESIPVSEAMHKAAYAVLALSLSVFAISINNAELALSEKGFFIISFLSSLYSSLVIQKNVRDLEVFKKLEMKEEKKNEEILLKKEEDLKIRS